MVGLGRRNHATVQILDCDSFTWTACTSITGPTVTFNLVSCLPTPPPMTGRAPEGRNGHTATFAERKIFFIGGPSFDMPLAQVTSHGASSIGWLGSGPLAASDLNVLDVDALHWLKPQCTGHILSLTHSLTHSQSPHATQRLIDRHASRRLQHAHC